jgi:DNA-binding CsgD family transcriptional regulator
MLAVLHSVRGDGARSAHWLRELESIVAQPMTMRNREWLASVRVRLKLGTGDLEPLSDWMRAYDYRASELSQADADQLASRLHELEQLITVLEGTSQWQSLCDTAPHLLRASGANRPWFAVRALTGEAVALEALGRSDDADQRWLEALVRGEDGGFVRVYLDGDPLRKRLLDRAAALPASHAAATRVLRASSRSSTQKSDPVILSDRQTAVLDRVALGDSNKAIAAALGVSVSTVKTHLRALFTKLGATSRTHAIAEARRQGLIS